MAQPRRHSHLHSHRRAHPHAQGYDVYPQHEHSHAHSGIEAVLGGVPDRATDRAWAPPHRPHRHTPEEAASIEADYRRLA